MHTPRSWCSIGEAEEDNLNKDTFDILSKDKGHIIALLQLRVPCSVSVINTMFTIFWNAICIKQADKDFADQ